MFEPPFAHLGHLYVSLPLFGGPVLLLAVLVWYAGWRERRRVAAGEAPTESRVTTTSEGDRAVIAVAGVLDYPALLDIEAELELAGRNDATAVVLDLRELTAVDERSAGELPSLVDGVWPALDVSVLPPPPELRPALERAHALEGIQVVSD